MTISLRTNVTSLQANQELGRTNDRLSSNMQHLASGLRINSAADDAAGLAVSEQFRADIRSLAQVKRNANDGISLIQTAEGALSEVSSILTRMRELATQAATDTVSVDQKAYVANEFGALREELDRIGQTASFNGLPLLSGDFSDPASALTFQVGITSEATQQISVEIATMSPSALGIELSSLDDSPSARATLSSLDSAIDQISTQRATLGATQNRLQVAVNNISTSFTNLNAANARIRDVDVADETSRMARNQILMQSGVSVLAQANQIPELALTLLK